ncbi:MAG: alanine racemase [Solirubrobacteraceae bacterium]
MARALAEVDLGAVAANCERLQGALAPQSSLCAVVKADAYGHGAVPVARAALGAGARWLAVASAEEAAELRAGGVDEAPILVMGRLEGADLELALGARCDVVIWREDHVDELMGADAVRRGGAQARVHVKLDTGMGRLGTRDPDEAARTVERVAQAPGLQLVGVMTHFATADQPQDGGFFERQLEAFTAFQERVRAQHPATIAHAANSAALLRSRDAHFDMARCGIAVYGMDPFGTDPLARELLPALSLRSVLADVKLCRTGDSTGYGRRFIAQRDTWLGMVAVGYGDGFRRGLSGNAEVLVEGRRHPVVGTVSMDHVAVDLGRDPAAQGLRGAEVVLIGQQGSERITAEELAGRLDTINYEITCGLSGRVQRRHMSAGRPGPWDGEARPDSGEAQTPDRPGMTARGEWGG